MTPNHSPLRYPGGKQVIFPTLQKIIHSNKFTGGVYVEPYAGGAGAALALLFGEHVDRLLLNDADPAIFSFWHSVLSRTDALLSLLRECPLNIDEWRRQREVYSRPTEVSPLALGFAAFYLNRCNRSGIIANAGVIGGLAQGGKWKMDARFNRIDLERRIAKIARYADRINVSNRDAIVFLEDEVNHSPDCRNHFVYLDPPYYVKGSQLYLSYYAPEDHALLAAYLQKKAKFSWVLTYDDANEIRNLYSKLTIIPFNLRYSASAARTGCEVLISAERLVHEGSNLFSIAS